MKKHIKKLTAAALCIIMLASSIHIAALAVEEAPEQNPLYLPLRMVFEQGGAEVDWDDTHSRVIAEFEDRTFEFFIGNNNARLNGELLALNFPVVMMDGIVQISYFDVAFLFADDTGGFDTTIMTAVVSAFQFMQALSLPGITVALVDTNNGFTWTQGFGFADTQEEIYVDGNTVFGVGSISKTLTAIAVMQLVEEGIITLDTPIVSYLPGFRIAPSPIFGGDYRNITARMLLTHTSGIFPNILGHYAVTTGDFYPAFFNNFLEILAEYFMNTAEDEVFTYNNNGYNVLGILVAAMTGDDNYFDDFIRYTDENIFAPAGMTRSAFALNNAIMPYLARPYVDADTPAAPIFMNSISTGSMFSSAYDMARFMHILLSDDGTLVSPGTISRMMRPHDFDFSLSLGGMEYGFGFVRMTDMNGFRTVGHNGAIIYYYADMILDVDNGIGVFVAINGANGLFAMSPLASAILQTAVTEKGGSMNLMPPRADLAAVPIELTAEQLERLEGVYVGQQYFLIEANEDGILSLIVPGAEMPPFLMTAMSDGSFVSDAGRFWFDEVEADGESLIVLRQGDLGFHMVAVRGEIEDFMATESFLNWVGTFVAQPAQGEVALVSALTYAVDSFGLATVTTSNLAPVAVTVAVQTTDDVFVLGAESIVTDSSGRVMSFELAGMRFARQAG